MDEQTKQKRKDIVGWVIYIAVLLAIIITFRCFLMIGRVHASSRADTTTKTMNCTVLPAPNTAARKAANAPTENHTLTSCSVTTSAIAMTIQTMPQINISMFFSSLLYVIFGITGVILVYHKSRKNTSAEKE